MILSNLFWVLIVITFILGSIIIINKPKVKDIISLLFIIYIVFLAFIVTSKQTIYYESNFIPFKEIFRYEIFSKLFFKNIIGNIILFIPLGFLIGYKTKIKHFYSAVFLSFYFSFFIETFQLMIGRVFDIDDILLNMIGGLIGYIVYKMCK